MVNRFVQHIQRLSHLQRQFNELILVRVAAFGEGLEDLREKKEL